MKNPKDNKTFYAWHPFLLPHEWLARLWQIPGALDACRPKQGSKVLDALQNVCAFLNLPVTGIIPFGVHGDAVPVLGTFMD